MKESDMFCLLAILLISSLGEAAKWSYTGKTGVDYWHELFKDECSGANQSPIDVEPEQTLYDPNLKEFAIWYDPPKPGSEMYVINNGHSLQVDLEGEFYVTNGGLKDVYKAAQFHFHWGSEDDQGSEHLVEGQASPIEMHLVTFNRDKYEHIGQAVTEPDGLAVLGVMFEITEEDNPVFENIVKSIKHVRDPDDKVRMHLPPKSTSIRNILPADISRYYRYKGSLTTPDCFESVTWTVFDQKQTLSYRQLKEFRSLLQPKKHHHHHHHHKHHENDGDSTGRKKRSLTRRERQLEDRAIGVLEELGVKDHYQEEVELWNAVEKSRDKRQMMADMPTEEETNMVEIKETGTNEAAKQEPTYTQDVMVDNYRPAQPLNGRIVYRSFKLRTPPPPPSAAHDAAAASSGGEYTVDVHASGRSSDEPCDGAASLWASMGVVLVSMLLSFSFA